MRKNKSILIGIVIVILGVISVITYSQGKIGRTNDGKVFGDQYYESI